MLNDPHTPERPTRYPPNLRQQLDPAGKPRPLLHRRDTSHMYETLEDLLKEAGYKETRIFTPEMERRQEPECERGGVGGAVVKLFSSFMSRKPTANDGDGDGHADSPPSPLAHRIRPRPSTLRMRADSQSGSSGATVRPPRPSSARLALRHAASAPHFKKGRPPAPAPPPLPATWLESLSAALLKPLAATTHAHAHGTTTAPRIPTPTSAHSFVSDTTLVPAPRKPTTLSSRPPSSVALTITNVVCCSARPPLASVSAGWMATRGNSWSAGTGAGKPAAKHLATTHTHSYSYSRPKPKAKAKAQHRQRVKAPILLPSLARDENDVSMRAGRAASASGSPPVHAWTPHAHLHASPTSLTHPHPPRPALSTHPLTHAPFRSSPPSYAPYPHNTAPSPPSDLDQHQGQDPESDSDSDGELDLATLLIPSKRQHSIRSLRDVLGRDAGRGGGARGAGGASRGSNRGGVGVGRGRAGGRLPSREGERGGEAPREGEEGEGFAFDAPGVGPAPVKKRSGLPRQWWAE